MATVRDEVFRFLREVGTTMLFGNPGSTELGMFVDFPDDFRYVLGLHESVAVGMAAGWSLGTGRAGVVSLHSAGGVGNSLGAVFNAFRDRVPLVLVAGQQSRDMLPARPFLAADEPASFPRPYVKWSRQPERGADVAGAFAEAYRVAMTPPRGPVFLSVPADDWDREAEPVVQRRMRTGFVAADPVLRELADALGAARAPAFVVGPGVADEHADAEVVALAERVRAAVWISPLSGRSGFPEDHRLFAGFLPPVRDQLAARLAGHDLVVALGAPVFTYHVAADGPVLAGGTRLFQLDCDAGQLAWSPIGTGILTTLRPALAALTGQVAAATRPEPARRTAPDAAPDTDPIRAERVLDLLRELMPDDVVLVEEAPTHRDPLHERIPVRRDGGFLTTGSGALGWGLPLAVGRALAGTGERVVCVVGDGSAMYTVQALWSAARQHAGVTFVVLDNGGYGAVRGLGERIGMTEVPGTDIGGLDIATVATGLGCPASSVTSAAELPGALRTALAADGPILLHVPVVAATGPMYQPWAG